MGLCPHEQDVRTERWPLATAPFRLGAALSGAVLLGAFLAASPAKAEDFTGFYAGINAGYGWSRERKSGDAKPGTPLPAWGQPQVDHGLPPSAARAAGHNPAFPGARSGTR